MTWACEQQRATPPPLPEARPRRCRAGTLSGRVRQHLSCSAYYPGRNSFVLNAQQTQMDTNYVQSSQAPATQQDILVSALGCQQCGPGPRGRNPSSTVLATLGLNCPHRGVFCAPLCPWTAVTWAPCGWTSGGFSHWKHLGEGGRQKRSWVFLLSSCQCSGGIYTHSAHSPENSPSPPVFFQWLI